MKKQWIIAGVLIVLGVAYLLLKPQGQINYEDHSFSGWKAEDIVSINYGEGKTLVKQQDQWMIQNPPRPVEQNK
ncbi:MAG: hypothetical protein PF447_12590, partial [Spirochaetaceae bacterium]|nr:hypothetical protein [Spirochaetaceae bacterium]